MDKRYKEIAEELGGRLIKAVEADILELENEQKYKEFAKEFNNQPVSKRYLDFFIVYYWAASSACGRQYSAGDTKLICEVVFEKVSNFLETQSQKGLDLKDYIKEKEEADFFSRQFANSKVLEVTPVLIWRSIVEKRFFDYNNAAAGSSKLLPVAVRFYKHIFGSDPSNDFNSSVLISHFTGLLSRVFAIRIDSASQAEILKYSRIIETNPGYAKAYYNRAVAYFVAQDYDKSWRDVRKAKELGCEVDPAFLKALKKSSGREE